MSVDLHMWGGADSMANNYSTGQIFTVDGGETMGLTLRAWAVGEVAALEKGQAPDRERADWVEYAQLADTHATAPAKLRTKNAEIPPYGGLFNQQIDNTVGL